MKVLKQTAGLAILVIFSLAFAVACLLLGAGLVHLLSPDLRWPL
jgi:hypothetical protein